MKAGGALLLGLVFIELESMFKRSEVYREQWRLESAT